jgi:ATP-dependent DNA helicase PIF1
VQCPVYPAYQDTELGDPPPFSVVARTQILLLPAWAITIHKSQGIMLERVVVNLDHIFEPQMAYVALSRARSLKGLRVVSRVGLEAL